MDTKNKLIKINGVVIMDKDYKEYDKLLTIFSKELGKIQVYAFGVRKQNSRNISKCRLLVFSEFEIRNINDKYQLESAKLIESFENITYNYINTCYASYVIELADYFGFENLENESIYDLLYYTFKAISDGKVNIKLIRRIYELKMLMYEGIYKDSKHVPDKLKYTWDFIINTKIDKLYSFNLSDELLNMLCVEIDIEMREKVEKKFKTLKFIEDEK